MSDYYGPDLLDGGNGVALEAHATLTSDQSGALDRLARALRDGPQPAPVFARFAASGVIPGEPTGPLTLALGGPQQGRFWYVRSIVVGGATPIVTAAGTADVFVLAGEPGQTQPATADWRDRADTLPLAAFYGRGELALRNNERLYVRVNAGTFGQLYTVACSIEDMQEHAGRQEWGL